MITGKLPNAADLFDELPRVIEINSRPSGSAHIRMRHLDHYDKVRIMQMMKVRVSFYCILALWNCLAPQQACIAASSAIANTNAAPGTPPVTIETFIGQGDTKENHDVGSCQWLALTLDFIKSLIWPGLVAGIVVYYRKEIREKLSKLLVAKTPAGELEFAEALASKKMDDQKAEPHLLQSKEKNDAIRTFVSEVTKEFLRAASWNGLKIMYLCTECQKKRMAFDLRQVCASDDSMSYDYAFGYIVASCSAQFLRYETPDNVRILITQVLEDVHKELMPAIEGRLRFVGPAMASDFNSQLNKIKTYIASLEATGGKG